MFVVFGWKNPAASAFLQLVIDNEKKTITRGYYLKRYTDVKVTSRQQLNRIQENYINAGYTLIND